MAHRSTERRNKAWLDDFKARQGCVDCGFGDARALEFHHLDPATKNPRLRKKDLVSLPVAEIRAEVELCEVICANCHRIRHAVERAAAEFAASPMGLVLEQLAA